MLTYYFFRLAGWLVPRLPLGLMYWVADRIGWVAYYTLGARRRVLTANLGHVLGPQSDPARLRQAVMSAFRLWIRNQIDFFLSPTLDSSDVEQLVTVRGWENVEQAQSLRKGLIIVSIHFGAVEIVALTLAVRGLRPVALHERLEPRPLYEYVSGIRASHGLPMVPVGDASALKLLFRTLRANGAIALAADRDTTGNGRVVTFFGAPARLPDGHVTLALRTGAPALLSVCYRRPGHRYEVTVEPPIVVKPTGNAEADVEAGMREMVAALERVIGAAPDQWTYFHPVWLDS